MLINLEEVKVGDKVVANKDVSPFIKKGSELVISYFNSLNNYVEIKDEMHTCILHGNSLVEHFSKIEMKKKEHLCNSCTQTSDCDWYKYCSINIQITDCECYDSVHDYENKKAGCDNECSDIEDSGKSDVPLNKYDRVIHDKVNDNTCIVDVYSVLDAFNVTCPALQHLIKKALCTGLRGHKSKEEDLKDIFDSAIRAQELSWSRK